MTKTVFHTSEWREKRIVRKQAQMRLIVYS